MRERTKSTRIQRLIAAASVVLVLVGLGQLSPDAAEAGVGHNCTPTWTEAPATSLVGYYGYSYSFFFEAYSCPSPSIGVSTGSLPTGMSLSGISVRDGIYSSRTLSGYPQPGTYTFTMMAANGNAPVSRTFTMTVYGDPSFTAASPPSGAVGNSYSYTFSANNNASIASSGNVPPGLNWSGGGTSRTLSGTPTTAGTYSFNVSATNSSNSDSRTVTIIMRDVPGLPATTVPGGTTGVAYSHNLLPTGYPVTVTSTGTLPTGLSLSTAGVLSGTPTAVGTYNFTVKNSTGVGTDATRSLQVLIADGSPVLTAKTAPSSWMMGQAGYTYQYAATSPGPLTWSTVGTLPAGLTLDPSTGLLSGTPTLSGDFGFQVIATNAGGSASVQQYVYISQNPIFVGAPPVGTKGTAYSYSFNSVGWPAYTDYSSSNFNVPGLTFTNGASNQISGTPTVGGFYPFTVIANKGGITTPTSKTFTLIVNAPLVFSPPPVTTYTMGNGVPWTPIQYQVSGYPRPTSWSSGGYTGLPPGLSVNQSGQLVGTPTTPGNYWFGVAATLGASSVSQIHYVSIYQKPAFTGTAPVATAGSSYSYTYGVTGFPANYYWGVKNGPPGLAFNAGTLSWDSPVRGSYAVTIWAGTDSTYGEQVVTLVVNEKLSFTAASPGPTAVVGTAYSGYNFATVGYPAATGYTVTSGALPPSVTLSAAGVLSGTPTGAGGVYTFRVTATNGVTTDTTTADMTITVNLAPALTAQSPTLTATVGTAYSAYQYGASGYPAPTYALAVAGTLPPGMSVSSSGLLSGTPTASGSYTFVVRATNAQGQVAATSKTIVVSGPPSFVAASPSLSAQVGAPYSAYTFTAPSTPVSTFSATGLPPGLSISSAGVVSGTPTQQGAFPFTVTATNGFAPNAITASATMTVAAAGVRTAWVSSGEIARLQTGASSQFSTGQLLLTVQDSTNSLAGWNVTVQSSAFVYSGSSGGTDIPASAFSIISVGAVSKVSGATVATGTDALPTGPQSAALSAGVTGALSTARKTILAAPGYGSGVYSQPLNVALAVPGGSKPGLYSATLTVTIASGP